jgi:protein-S-isoprenylcysteine O-methyltransferase Ste14
MRHVVYDLITAATWTCWAVVGVVWAVGAAFVRRRGAAVRRQEGRDLASRLGVALGLAAMASPAQLWRPVTVASPLIRLTGVPVLLAATTATVAARFALGSMWSSGAVAREGAGLRTDGPYAVTRHPIYAGIVAMLAGTALTQGGGRWAAILVAVTFVLLAKIRAEERLLSGELPEEYERYRRQVPRLIPHPRRRRDARAA